MLCPLWRQAEAAQERDQAIAEAAELRDLAQAELAGESAELRRQLGGMVGELKRLGHLAEVAERAQEFRDDVLTHAKILLSFFQVKPTEDTHLTRILRPGRIMCAHARAISRVVCGVRVCGCIF